MLETERRRPRGNSQPADLRQDVEHFLGESIGEVFVLLVVAHVDERQHGDRRRPRVDWSRRLLLRGNCVRQIAMRHLEHRFRPIEVLEGVLTQTPEQHVSRQVVATQLVGDGRYQSLPTTSQGKQPCDPIECGTKVVAIAQFGRTTVQRHAHANSDRVRPRLGIQRLLRGDGGLERIGGRDEGGTCPVANGLHEVTTVSFNALPQ